MSCGYSDVGPVTDDELLTRDRGGKPRVPDLFLDAEEHMLNGVPRA